MINTESAFNSLGIDAITGVELMEWLGLSPIDFTDSGRFNRFKTVIDYFKQFPVDTQRFMIRRVTNGKNVDKLQHVWEYTELLKNKKAVEEAIEKIKTERSALGAGNDPILVQNFAQREIDARTALNHVTQEMALYEK